MIEDKLKKKIKVSYEKLQSLRKVAHLYKVSHSTVRNVVNNLYKEEPEKRGPKKKTTSHQENCIKVAINKLEAKGSRVTAKEIQYQCELYHLSTRTIQRIIRSIDFEAEKGQKAN